MRYIPRGGVLLATLVMLGCTQASVPVQTGRVNSTGASRLPHTERSWLAFGDSITYEAFGDAEAFRAPLADRLDSVVNAGMPGATSLNAVWSIDDWLGHHPARVVGVAFGTNDAFGQVAPQTFKTAMATVIEKIKAAGATPVLATIPYSPRSEMGALPRFNQAISELRAQYALPAGPDLYAWFSAHPEELREDGIHATADGSASIRRLWAEAARSFLP